MREAHITAHQSGLRLDKVAAELFPEFSRAQLSRWIKLGELTVDGHAVSPKDKVHGGEKLALNSVAQVTDAAPAAQCVDFDVVYEDEGIMVVNKPAGLVVHPGAGVPDGTLVNGLLKYRPALAALPRAGLVHRLDKDTSGLLLIAANPITLTALTRALKRREIQRRYVAIVEGVLTGGRDVEAPIGRDPRNRLKQTVRDDGRWALTRIRVQQRYRAHTLVDVELATGRTHQIRVHAAEIGYPIVGDRRYGARGRLPSAPEQRLLETIRAFTRQALHARRLVFAHPESGLQVDVSEGMPADMTELVDALAEDARLA